MVLCGLGKTPCAINQCISCRDGGVPFVYGPLVCITDGGIPPRNCLPAIPCDGPEDCPKGGEECWEQEFGPSCGTRGFDTFSTTLCHSDCDCPSERPRCSGDRCQK